MKLIRQISVVLFAWVLAATALAAADPVAMLSTTANSLLKELRSNKSKLDSMSFIEKTVNKTLLPHVDVTRMARFAAGRQAWLGANAAQRQRFVKAFTTLVVRTYGAALSEYTSETVRFQPIRGGIKPNQQRVQVSSQIIRSAGQPINVDYRLVRQGADWKVYDFSVEGVSMIRSFQSQFASELSQGGGLDALTQKLETHNKKHTDVHQTILDNGSQRANG